MDRKHRLNIILTFVIGLTLLYLGLVVSFFALNLSFTPGQIALQLMPPGPPDPLMLQQIMQQYGLNDPLFFRFLRYLGDFLVSNWGISSSIVIGMPVSDLLMRSVPHMIELLIFPLIIGIILGYVIGRVSNRTKRNWLKNGIQSLSAVGIAVPIFFFGMFLQFTLAYLNPLFPAIGYKSVIHPSPPLITGFMTIDAILSGNLPLALDILYHYALPTIILLVAITALMTRAYSSNRAKDAYKKKTILSHTAKTSMVFGAIFTYLFLIDVTFNFSGFGSMFMTALTQMDYFLLRGLLFVFIMLFAGTLIISNFIFSIHGLIKDKNKLPLKEVAEPIEREPRISTWVDLKTYLNKIVRSPLIYIGLVAVLFPIFVAIFPGLISGYSFEEVFGIYSGSWSPPFLGTPLGAHPLGQAKFGRDVLAQVAYGTRDSMIFGAGAVFIGLIGGLIFGLLASKFNRKVHTITMSVSLIFYVLPGILLILLATMIFGNLFGLLMFTTGLLLIPSFTRIIANTEFRIVPIGKKILSYLPLFAGFAILLYVSLGFLGFNDPLTVNLGGLINEGRSHLYDAPWASLWPGLITFLIVVSLFILHEGLVKNSR
ncbi:MAG: hypothetical protein KGD61_01770 [Candidatus Lokiarchaeota archaeon]|nr:hypothetical protein [Candidatus Lokiarchaeota archaeon]